MPVQRSLIALLVAAVSSYAMLKHTRRMLHEGTSVEEGGGWTAVVLAECIVALGGLAAAFS